MGGTNSSENGVLANLFTPGIFSGGGAAPPEPFPETGSAGRGPSGLPRTLPCAPLGRLRPRRTSRVSCKFAKSKYRAVIISRVGTSPKNGRKSVPDELETVYKPKDITGVTSMGGWVVSGDITPPKYNGRYISQIHPPTQTMAGSSLRTMAGSSIRTTAGSTIRLRPLPDVRSCRGTKLFKTSDQKT